MKEEEIAVEKYLRKTHGENIIYEPRGHGTTPDFSIEHNLGIEVRRLNQHFYNGEAIEGLEDLSFSLQNITDEVLGSFDSKYTDESFFVFVDYERPLIKQMREIKHEMKKVLHEFLQSKETLPLELHVIENLKLWIYPSMPNNGWVFRVGGSVDGDGGGWVIQAYIENIRHCIATKSSKIKKYKSSFGHWWLYLVDYMNLGLDNNVIQEVIKAISDLGEFEKIVIIDRAGEALLFTISQ